MDRKTGYLTSGGFAALCGTTKETLRHYKDIGLLIPARQGGNGYSYYDVEQFYDFYATAIFRQTGTPLEEIRRCMRERDARKTLALLRRQKTRMNETLRALEQMDFILSGSIRNLELGTEPDLLPRTAWFDAEHLLAIPAEELADRMPPLASDGERMIAVLERCRELCREHRLQTDHQLGSIHRPGKRRSLHHHPPIHPPPGTGRPSLRLGEARRNLSVLLLPGPLGSLRGLSGAGPGHPDTAAFNRRKHLCLRPGRLLLNGEEENAVSMLSVRLADSNEPPKSSDDFGG